MNCFDGQLTLSADERKPLYGCELYNMSHYIQQTLQHYS